MTPPVVAARTRLARHAFAIARDLGLSDDERREWAMMLPSRRGASGPVSWADLTTDEFAHLVIQLDGARLHRDLIRLRHPGTVTP